MIITLFAFTLIILCTEYAVNQQCVNSKIDFFGIKELNYESQDLILLYNNNEIVRTFGHHYMNINTLKCNSCEKSMEKIVFYFKVKNDKFVCFCFDCTHQNLNINEIAQYDLNWACTSMYYKDAENKEKNDGIIIFNLYLLLSRYNIEHVNFKIEGTNKHNTTLVSYSKEYFDILEAFINVNLKKYEYLNPIFSFKREYEKMLTINYIEDETSKIFNFKILETSKEIKKYWVENYKSSLYFYYDKNYTLYDHLLINYVIIELKFGSKTIKWVLIQGLMLENVISIMSKINKIIGKIVNQKYYIYAYIEKGSLPNFLFEVNILKISIKSMEIGIFLMSNYKNVLEVVILSLLYNDKFFLEWCNNSLNNEMKLKNEALLYLMLNYFYCIRSIKIGSTHIFIEKNIHISNIIYEHTKHLYDSLNTVDFLYNNNFYFLSTSFDYILNFSQ